MDQFVGLSHLPAGTREPLAMDGKRSKRMLRGSMRPRAANHRPQRAGMTLIETALATIIVGVGVLAIVIAQQAFHNQNAWSNRAATATRLGNEIREMTFNLPRHDPVTRTAYWGPDPGESTPVDFDDLDDFDGQVFSAADGTGPLNAARQIIPNMNGWAQVVQVDMVDPFDINHVYPVPDTPDDYPEHYMMRVQVIVTYQQGNSEPEEVTRVSWIAPN